MNKDDTPAFPCEWDYIGSNRAAANGMTMRDYFAAKAMQGLLAAGRDPQYGSHSMPDLAHASYQIAGAMLKARTE